MTRKTSQVTQDSSQMKEENKTRGRPKGSKSFHDIELKELSDSLPESSMIPVSRTWLMKLKSLGVNFKPKENTSAVKKIAEDDKIEMKLEK